MQATIQAQAHPHPTPVPPAKLSTKTVHLPELRESLVKLAEKTGLASSYVEMVASAALGNNIRAVRKEDEVKIVIALAAELEYCAVSYCGASKTDEMVYDEVVMFVMDRFGHIGLKEIREAFRMAAAAEFEVDLKSYYGLFTVKLMGDILTGYNNYRNKVLQEFTRANSVKQAEEKESLRKQNWDTEAWAERRISVLKALENPDYHCFTAYDYEYFTKTGQLQFTEEQKRKAWIDSHQYAYQQVLNASNANIFNISLRKQLERVMTNQPDQGYKAKRICVAQQLLVMRWIFPETEAEPELETIK